MASTRNNNTREDYLLQQKSYKTSRNYIDFKNSANGAAYKTALPVLGITPSHMPREAFSNNSVDIEGALFGINSTNLVNPQPTVVPSLKKLPEVSYFDRMRVIMPEPLVVEKNQRPFPVP